MSFRFISHAEGSPAELDSQLQPSINLGFCSESDGLIHELRKMLNALRRSVSIS